MSPILVLLTSAALGVEVGWEPLPGGGHEYTIQLEPQMLDLLKKGHEEIFSEVPPEINVRRYRIKVGTGTLAREAGPLGAQGNVGQPTPATPPADASPFGAPPANATAGGTAPEWPPADPAASEPQAGTAPQATTPDPAAADPWANEPASPSDQDLAALPPHEDSQVSAGGAAEPQPPGKLPETDQSRPVRPANYGEPEAGAAPAAGAAGSVNLQKPSLAGEGPSRRWGLLLGSIALLSCSLGANLYLGWVAWDQRHRYREAVARFRGATA
jgi:hypothetical protein